MNDASHLSEAGPAATLAAKEAAPVPAPSRWSVVGDRIMIAERFALAAVLGTWGIDAVLLALTRGGATWMQWLQGVGSAAFVGMSTAMVLAMVLGPVVVPMLQPVGRQAVDGWRALRAGEASARHGLLARVLVAPPLLAAWGALVYQVSITVIFAFARPDTMAIGMMAANIGLALLLVLLWPGAVSVGGWIVERFTRVRGLAWVAARAWPLPLFVLVLVAAVVGVAAYVGRRDLAMIPWLQMLPALGVLVGFGAAAALPGAKPTVRRVALAFTVVVFVGGFVAAIRLRPEASKTQSIAFDRALSGRAGYAAWVFAMDFDRDGQISMLGGGDCAPFDPRRYTGAADHPGNGVDEDCDGTDLSAGVIRTRPPMVIPAGRVPDKPTVVFVTIDALSALELHAIGNRSSIMPNLDALADQSMVFTSCFAQGPSTRMSFPSILTSRYDSQLVFEYSSRMPYSWSEKERSLQDLFDDAGYTTAAVIPNIYFDSSRWVGVTRGFQFVDTSPMRSAFGKHDAAEVTDAALSILSRPHDKPLYLWLHYYDAHPPYGAPPGVKPPDHDDRTYYVEELGYIDQNLGRLVTALAARPEPVYLVVTSDHATSFHPVPESRHFHYGYDIYTSTLHVPLVFHGPGIRPGKNDHVVATMDVAPTLANLVHLDPKGRFEGTSLAQELLTGAVETDRTVFGEFFLPENVFRGHGEPLEFVSLRTDRWDMILNRKHGTYELYDWRADYWEQNDVYEDQVHAPEVTKMRSVLGAFVLRFASTEVTPLVPSLAPKFGAGRSGFPAVEP
jgi:arylsulfatase A-like enzyme